jgi:hypothetical protein
MSSMNGDVPWAFTIADASPVAEAEAQAVSSQQERRHEITAGASRAGSLRD